MAKNIFQNLGKSPSQIHTPNIYEKSLAETKAKGGYEQSIKALAPTTYQQANQLNFQFAHWFALLYHFVSALLGLATVCMLAYLFSGVGTLGKYPIGVLYFLFGLVFLILSALLIGIEVFKSILARGIFKKSVIGENVPAKSIIGLVVVMLFSILVSAVGGYVLSYSMNDKTTAIHQAYTLQADSLSKLHKESLEAVNASIEAYKANLNKGSYWAKYATREKLDKAIQIRNDLLKTTNNQQLTIQSAKEKEIGLNISEGSQYGFISALVVLVLEILSILAYWHQYIYHANCEKEAANFQVLESIQVVQQAQGKTEIQEMKELLQNLLSNNNQFQLASNVINPNSQKVGFTFGLQKEAENKDSDNRLAKIAVPSNGVQPNHLIEGNRICKHCGKAYMYKHHKQQYCTKECRDTAWEQRTGKKLIFRKGKE